MATLQTREVIAALHIAKKRGIPTVSMRQRRNL